MSPRDTRPRHYIRDQDQGSNPQHQDSENTVSRLSRDETVSRDFPSLTIIWPYILILLLWFDVKYIEKEFLIFICEVAMSCGSRCNGEMIPIELEHYRKEVASKITHLMVLGCSSKSWEISWKKGEKFYMKNESRSSELLSWHLFDFTLNFWPCNWVYICLISPWVVQWLHHFYKSTKISLSLSIVWAGFLPRATPVLVTCRFSNVAKHIQLNCD